MSFKCKEHSWKCLWRWSFFNTLVDWVSDHLCQKNSFTGTSVTELINFWMLNILILLILKINYCSHSRSFFFLPFPFAARIFSFNAGISLLSHFFSFGVTCFFFALEQILLPLAFFFYRELFSLAWPVFLSRVFFLRRELFSFALKLVGYRIHVIIDSILNYNCWFPYGYLFWKIKNNTNTI